MSAPNNKKLTYKEKSGLAFVAQDDPPFIKAMKAKMGFKEPAKLEDKYADEDAADFDDPETELLRMREEERPQVVVLNPETDLSQNELTKELEVKRKEEDEKKIAEFRITFKKPVKRNLDDTKEVEEKKRKEKDDSPKPQKNLLSFGDDEEDE